MKLFVFALILSLMSALPVIAAPFASSARTAIPEDVQQIISVDYRALKNSETALALKERVLPQTLKDFENNLKSMGVDVDRDLDQLTFVSFRTKSGLRSVGIAQGGFSAKQLVGKLRVRKIKPVKHRLSLIYPSGTGMQMSFLDENTMLFGEGSALKAALDARDGEVPSMASNAQITDSMQSVESGPVWSVLDQTGTQNMMRSALGDASKLADYDVIKKRLLGSQYIMDFARGVNFDLDVVTSDSMTAATLSSLVKAGMLYRKMGATPVEKTALDSMSVNSQSAKLQLHFKSDDQKFRSLLSSELFAAVSR
jgi:hypothetical protein